MSRFHRLTALGAVLAATGFLSFATTAAQADSVNKADSNYVDGRYHSVINGIPDYDGFDGFRDVNGDALPGWQQELGSRR